MSVPEGLIVKSEMFCTVYFFFVCPLYSSLCLCVFGAEEEEECSYHRAPSGSAQSKIDKQDAFHYFLSAQSFVPLLAFRRCWPVHDSCRRVEVISR